MIAFSLAQLCAHAECTVALPQAPSGDAAAAAKSAAAAQAADAAAQFVIECVTTSSKDLHEQGAECGATLFIPLKGERFDGHDFILDAMRHGAAAVASHKSESELKEHWTEAECKEFDSLRAHCAWIETKDTLRFLGQCGAQVRHMAHATVGAITGSCGKTTVKEMCASILSQRGATLFTAGNFNNDVGVPLTLLRMEQSHDFAIIEQGASHLKDIERTCEFVDADFALITNVGQAHILGFGSQEGVYIGKSEILKCLFHKHPAPQRQVAADAQAQGRGIGIVPADSPFFARWQQDFKEEAAAGKLLSFGESAAATMQVSNIIEGKNELAFHLESHDSRYPLSADFKLEMMGRHNAINAAGAALLALVMGATQKDVVQGLHEAQLISGRLTPQHFGQLTVIDDAYNASFNAVQAAIDTLSHQDGMKIFILGDMGELGKDEIALHEAVGRHAQGKVDLLLCIGPLSQYCVQAMGHQACHFLKHEDLIAVLTSRVAEKLAHHQEVCCLVKGSHAMHMEKVVSALQELGRQRCTPEA